MEIQVTVTWSIDTKTDAVDAWGNIESHLLNVRSKFRKMIKLKMAVGPKGPQRQSERLESFPVLFIFTNCEDVFGARFSINKLDYQNVTFSKYNGRYRAKFNVLEYIKHEAQSMDVRTFLSLYPEGITIKCDFNYLENLPTPKPCTSNLVPNPLGDSISAMFERSDMTDFMVVAGDLMVPCHKVVLAARSPVFKVR